VIPGVRYVTDLLVGRGGGKDGYREIMVVVVVRGWVSLVAVVHFLPFGKRLL
jgi:hypothetical protein